MSELDPLRDRPGAFTLFAALKAIERADGQGPRLGESKRLRDDPVRIVQPPYLHFAPTEIETFDWRSAVPRLSQYSFGLMGPNGPLPLHLTEYAYERLHQFDDPGVADFLAAFQHRVATLFYRAWAEADPATSAERPTTDRFAQQLGALIGLGDEAAQDRDAVPDGAKLHGASTLVMQARSAAGLCALVADNIALPVAVREYVGEWLDVPNEARLHLAGAPDSATLGLSSTLGAQSWQRESRFELTVGPMTLETLSSLLPGTPGLAGVRALIALYTNRQWNWQLRLVLSGEEATPVRLGSGERLGWTSWLGSKTGTADDVLIQGDPVGSERHTVRNQKHG